MTKNDTTNVIDRERYHYPRIKLRGADGKVRYSATRGDAVSNALISLTHEEAVEAVRVNGLKESLITMAERANRGAFRMSLSQSLRARVKRGETVVIGGIKVKSLDQAVKVKNLAA